MADSILTEEEVLIEKAKIAEMAEMHADMAETMKKLVGKVDHLDKNPRNLLSVAYKNLVGSKRSSWRVVRSMIDKLEKDLDDASGSDKPRIEERMKIAKDFLNEIVNDLKVICKEVVKLLDDKLLKTAAEGEEKTFFYKMKGDYYRYLSEVLKDDADEEEFKKVCDESYEAYKNASESGAELGNTNPVLLGNKLNFSVFHYEIRNDPKAACKLAKEAFDQAIGELDGLQEESYKDSTLIMQLLRDNLTLWTAEVSEDGGKDED